MLTTGQGFRVFWLEDQRQFLVGTLPSALLEAVSWELLWNFHPAEFGEVMIHGRLVKTPRWQAAYGLDYAFSGQVSAAEPVPPLLSPLLAWAKESVDRRLNGILVNWYDSNLGHYIGPHRDSTRSLIEGSPIVTISLGSERVFRLNRWKGSERHDFQAAHGSVFVLPWETNLGWTHQVCKRAADRGRRISVTLRAFR